MANKICKWAKNDDSKSENKNILKSKMKKKVK